MARPVHGLLRPLLPVCLLLLLQVSECSRLSPSSPADNDDHALHHHHQLLLLDEAEARTGRPPTSTDVARDGRTGADADDAAPSASTTTPPAARAVPAVAASSRPRQTSDRGLVVRAGMRPEVLLLRSKLARRFLAGAGGVDEAASATDGAAASCHSNNPHINCGPSASKP
ncbi:hypothetical protein BDA96_01G119600 [Sorghum bicolor]|jgi:hypothetical protein|uniref:Uncharacterized protein n=2 Tax=Sorghum bicolor TaxID=4558 RepID=A0A921RY98_SORBI|nr:hypothetical protein BDA96_01G119600 [Sorghum bicolor]KXG37718.1 hypothetical protein SORBI_3001G114600 [Sorghum bicolor]